MKNPELQLLRDEIAQSLQARVPADEPEPETPSDPQAEAGENLPSMEEGGEEPTPADGEAAENVVAYVNDLAAQHGLSPEDFYNLPVRLSGDREIPLGKAKDLLEQSERFDEERRQIERQREALTRQEQDLRSRMAQTQQAQAQLTQRQTQAKQNLDGIVAQYRVKMLEWDKQRAIEPGRVALEQQELGAAYAAAQQEMQAAQMDAQTQQAQAREQWMTQQHALLSQKIPDWGIPEKRKAIQSELQEFAVTEFQATPQELQNLDARMILLLQAALEGRKAKRDAEKALAAVKEKPPVAPRSARQSAVAQHRADVAELEKRALASGKTQDKLAAARAILGRK